MCIDNLENKLVKMKNELDHMKTMRKHLAYDVVSLGLAVKGVELTEKIHLTNQKCKQKITIPN